MVKNMDLESFAKEQLLKYLAKVPFNTLKKKKKTVHGTVAVLHFLRSITLITAKLCINSYAVHTIQSLKA